MSLTINNQLDFDLEILASKIANIDRNVEDYENIIHQIDAYDIVDIIKYYHHKFKGRRLQTVAFVAKNKENEKLKQENERLKEWENKTLDYDYFVEYYDKHKMNEKNEIRIMELEAKNESLHHQLQIEIDDTIIIVKNLEEKFQKEKEELETIIKKASKSNPDHNEPIIYCKECVTWTNDWNDDRIELKCCLECLPENYGYCEECVKWKPWGEICDVGELCNDCYVSDAED